MGIRIPEFLLTSRARLFQGHFNTTWLTGLLIVLPCFLFIWAAQPIDLPGFRERVILFFFVLGLGFFWGIPMLSTIGRLELDRKDGTLPLLVLTGLRPLEILLSRIPMHLARLVSYLMTTMPILVVLFAAYRQDLVALVSFIVLGPIDIQGCTRGGSGVEMPNGKALRADRGAV